MPDYFRNLLNDETFFELYRDFIILSMNRLWALPSFAVSGVKSRENTVTNLNAGLLPKGGLRNTNAPVVPEKSAGCVSLPGR